jgi:tight adherence protein B
MTRRLLLPGLLLAAATAVLLPGSAVGQPGELKVDLRNPDTNSRPGHVLATVALSGAAWDSQQQLGADAFTAAVDGQPANVTKVESLEATGRQVAVMLVVDTSGSMSAADNIIHARDAADQLVNELPPGTKVGVVAFSDQPQVVQGLTADRARVRSAIASLQANGETALRDAVVQASRLLSREPGQRNLVLLSDGADTSSAAKFDQTVAAVKRAKAAIYTLGLTAPAGEEQDPQALKALAQRAGGRAVTDLTGDQLPGLYQGIGRELASQYVVDVQLPQTTARTIVFQVEVNAGGTSGSDRQTLLLGPPAPKIPAVPGLTPAPALSRLEREQGRYLAALAAFVTVLLIALVVLIARPGGGHPFRALRQRLSPYSLTPAIVDHRPTTVFGSSELAGRATAMAETLVRRGNLEEAFLDRLEAAGLNMRVAEYVLVSLGSAFGFPLLVLAASRNFILSLLAVPIGTIAPFLFLSIKASRRQAKFDEQLPATLQLLAGALRAGHSLLQAVDTVVREADDPIAGEFQRVLTEARLGRPLEEAFDGMAKRMRSVDFAWTVMAINLQRQVGGNLAEVLGTVSQTIRDRYTLKRQIRALSAEGRLSSLILTLLPLVLFAALLAFNPVFLAPLYTTQTGLLLLGGAAVLMCIGILWMRKLTEIKV